MSQIVIVHLVPRQLEPNDSVHRLRNFGEDVFRQLREDDWGTVGLYEIDRATTQFAIRDVKASKLRRLITWIAQEADRQHLPITTEVIKGSQ